MDDTRLRSAETLQLERGIQLLNEGDASVRGELLNIACARLLHLTARLRRHFQGVEPNQSTEDVFQNASLRLYQALYDTPIQDVRQFYRMAAFQIRRELVDLCNRCQTLEAPSPDPRSPEPPAVNEYEHDDASADSITVDSLRQWALFHDSVDALPDPEREVFELVWYHELTRTEAAQLLGLPVRNVRSLWRAARLQLHDLLGEEEVDHTRDDD